MLIDYLLQQSICDGDNPDNLIIPSSEADALMTIHLNKNKLEDKRSISSCNVMRRHYSYYATREFCLVATICHSGHFFVTKVIFDVTKDTIFKEVTVYDSLRRGNRNKEAMKPNSPAAEFLCKLQSSLSCFVFMMLLTTRSLTIRGLFWRMLPTLPAQTNVTLMTVGYLESERYCMS